MSVGRSDEEHPVGILVIRVWQDGEPPVVRARFVSRFDVVAGQGRIGDTPPKYAAGLEDIAAITRKWLTYYLALADP